MRREAALDVESICMLLLPYSLSQKGYKWGGRVEGGIWGERTNIEGHLKKPY